MSTMTESVDVTPDRCSSELAAVDSSVTTEASTLSNTDECSTSEQSSSADFTLILQSLATQLEYYFSPANLSRDTYLRTLMGLNQGYVPASILATFAKVQGIIVGHPATAYEDVVPLITRAAEDYSGLLQVVTLDTNGRVVESPSSLSKDEDTSVPEADNTTASTTTSGSSTNTSRVLLKAIGPIDDNDDDGYTKSSYTARIASPVPPPTTSVPSSNQSPTTTVREPSESPTEPSTIILREIPESTTEEEVRQLLQTIDKCPAIKTIHREVGNCWFITVEPASRNVMVQTMLQLKSQQFQGQPIKARLKTVHNTPPASPSYHQRQPLAAWGSNSPAAAVPAFYPMPSLDHSTTERRKGLPRHQLQPSSSRNGGGSQSSGGPTKKAGGRGGGKNKTKNYSKKNNNNNNSPRPQGAVVDKNNNNSKNSSQNTKNEKSKMKAPAAAPPLLMVESHFPALGGEQERTTTTPNGGDAVTSRKNADNNGGGSKTEAVMQKQQQPSQEANRRSVGTGGGGEAGAQDKPVVAPYAAALLKKMPQAAFPAKKTDPGFANGQNNGSSSKKKGDAMDGNKKAESMPATGKDPLTKIQEQKNIDGEPVAAARTSREDRPKVVVAAVAPSWGGGKTFADVLKNEEQ